MSGSTRASTDRERGAVRRQARVPALVVAAILLWRRAPFIVVVVAAAVTAAGLRATGLP